LDLLEIMGNKWYGYGVTMSNFPVVSMRKVEVILGAYLRSKKAN